MDNQAIRKGALQPVGDFTQWIPRRLSTVFSELGCNADQAVTIGEIRDALADRGFAALLVLFAAFNLLPLPPGSTLVFGIPLMLVSAQMVAGHRTPWLPERVLRYSISAERFRSACGKLMPYLEWLERTVKPRHWPFARGKADRIVGVVTLVLGTVVFLPIPLGNWLPALSIALIGFALSERDGILLGAGVVVGILSFAVIGLVFGTAGYLASMAGFHF